MAWGETRQTLRRTLGERAFARLVAAFGGQHVRVPPEVETNAERRRRLVAASARIQRALDAGATYRATAKRERVDVATVVRAAKRTK